MKKILLIVKFLIFSILIEAQIIDWNNFNERKMDTVMFNVMNSYRNQRFGDSIVWSPVVQKEVMWDNYDFIKTNPNIQPTHNMRWKTPGRGNDLHDTLRSKIIKENVCPNLLNSLWMSEFRCYGLFCYTEILISIPKNNCKTYQEIANHAIDEWNKSDSHAGIMNATYKNKVIVGTITLYRKESQRIFISFVYIS